MQYTNKHVLLDIISAAVFGVAGIEAVAAMAGQSMQSAWDELLGKPEIVAARQVFERARKDSGVQASMRITLSDRCGARPGIAGCTVDRWLREGVA